MNIRGIQDRVEAILEKNVEARNNDGVLILEVMKQILKERGIDTNKADVWQRAIAYGNLYGIPTAESITRSRRKLQEKRPELDGIKARPIRIEQEEAYRQYARA